MAEEISLKEYTDARLLDLAKLGAVTACAIVAGVWISFSLNGRALRVALDSNNREVETHNGKIRQWEVERGEREAKLATKIDLEPLKADYDRRIGASIATGKFWGVIAVVAGLSLTLGFGLASVWQG